MGIPYMWWLIHIVAMVINHLLWLLLVKPAKLLTVHLWLCSSETLLLWLHPTLKPSSKPLLLW